MSGEIRVLALVVHRRKIGYAVLEGPSQLLDWGVAGCMDATGLRRATVPQRLVSVLNFYQPKCVAVRMVNARARGTGSPQSVELAVRRECVKRSISVCPVDATTVKKFFAAHSCTTRLQIAQVIGEWYLELVWHVPPKRKPWQSDSHAMPIFEAVAVGITFFQRLSNK